MCCMSKRLSSLNFSECAKVWAIMSYQEPDCKFILTWGCFFFFVLFCRRRLRLARSMFWSILSEQLLVAHSLMSLRMRLRSERQSTGSKSSQYYLMPLVYVWLWPRVFNNFPCFFFSFGAIFFLFFVGPLFLSVDVPLWNCVSNSSISNFLCCDVCSCAKVTCFFCLLYNFFFRSL